MNHSFPWLFPDSLKIPWLFPDFLIFFQNSLTFPWLEKVVSFFQVFQCRWEPCIKRDLQIIKTEQSIVYRLHTHTAHKGQQRKLAKLNKQEKNVSDNFAFWAMSNQAGTSANKDRKVSTYSTPVVTIAGKVMTIFCVLDCPEQPNLVDGARQYLPDRITMIN